MWRAPAASRSSVVLGIRRRDDRQFSDERSLLGKTMADQEGGGSALFPGADVAMPDVSEYTSARNIPGARHVAGGRAPEKFRAKALDDELPPEVDEESGNPAQKRAERKT